MKFLVSIHGSGPPLVLLHGNGGDHTNFDALVAALETNFTTYAIDSRGHGQSSNGKLSYPIMAKDVAGIISALHLERPALLGFSDGGIIGLLVAIKYPQVLSALITCGANSTPFGVPNKVVTSIIWRWLRTRDRFAKLLFTGPWISRRALASIRIPTLILAGENDIITAKETAKLAATIPTAEMHIFPNEDHGSYLTPPTHLTPAVTNFLARNDQSRVQHRKQPQR
jgi:pimeloyl-ACP methyl ester carboxylesterase